jgi:hypothetical protein
VPQDTEAPLTSLTWMPSRIPVQDALVAFVPEGHEAPRAPFSSYEQRWYPQPGGLQMVLPYRGEPFDASLFHVERGFWDHITCDLCTTHIPAMTLCYVTRAGAFKALCTACYTTNIVAKLGTVRALLWHIKRLVGVSAGA